MTLKTGPGWTFLFQYDSLHQRSIWMGLVLSGLHMFFTWTSSSNISSCVSIDHETGQTEILKIYLLCGNTAITFFLIKRFSVRSKHFLRITMHAINSRMYYWGKPWRRQQEVAICFCFSERVQPAPPALTAAAWFIKCCVSGKSPVSANSNSIEAELPFQTNRPYIL